MDKKRRAKLWWRDSVASDAKNLLGVKNWMRLRRIGRDGKHCWRRT